MKKNVLCFGEILWDTFGNEKIPGGAPMNVALHLLQQEIPTGLISSVGNDEAGQKLLTFLKENHLDTSLVQTDAKLPTCQVTVQLDDKQQATYIIPRPVSWDNIILNDDTIKQVKEADIIVFGSLACRTKVSFDTLLGLIGEKIYRVFDVNLRAPHYEQSTIETLAAMADVVKMNEDEIAILIGGDAEVSVKERMMAFQHKYHSKTICVTRGERGAIVWHQERFYEHPGYVVNVMDTVGAGDSFLATFLAGLLKDQPVEQIIDRACAVGAFVASQRGANPKYNEDGISAIVKSGQGTRL